MFNLHLFSTNQSSNGKGDNIASLKRESIEVDGDRKTINNLRTQNKKLKRVIKELVKAID